MAAPKLMFVRWALRRELAEPIETDPPADRRNYEGQKKLRWAPGAGKGDGAGEQKVLCA
jgi:hypothetical protein